MAHLWLTGMMGTGKSSIGRLLAERHGLPFYDLDEMIESSAGMSIPELFAAHGEEGFRRMEAAVVVEVASADAGVVATGGGAVLSKENVEAMRASGTIVLLRASPDELERRLAGSDGRPLLPGPNRTARIARLLEAREAAYERAADVSINTDGFDPSDLATRIEETCDI